MDNLAVIQSIYELLRSCDNMTLHMPSDKKHGIGRHIEYACISLLDKTIQAKYISKSMKKESLLHALTKLDLLRLLIRLCYENKISKDETCFKIQAQIDEIGRMLGGWYRSA